MKFYLSSYKYGKEEYQNILKEIKDKAAEFCRLTFLWRVEKISCNFLPSML